MTIEERIKCAIDYVSAHSGDKTEIKNDAANIYASNYDEYLIIWDAINK